MDSEADLLRFEVAHIPGKDNCVADGLSQMFEEDEIGATGEETWDPVGCCSGDTYRRPTDGFTKYVWMIPARRATTEAAVKLLDENYPTTGVSSSRGPLGTCASREASCHITTSPYYPNPSQAERFHRNLKNALIAYHHTNNRNWDTNLTWLQLAFSTAEHASHGRTPFELLLGYEPLQPINLQWEIFPEDWDEKPAQSSERRWAEALERLKRAQETVSRRYNRGREPVPYKVGDWVV
uniref:Integrase catalytic domain-containing protein n=1 Tax=Timema monikensis TaxID=170555 RepID=A0A7R9HJS6_9NEOP|nr:unnamed protein product [Timema monikensis]